MRRCPGKFEFTTHPAIPWENFVSTMESAGMIVRTDCPVITGNPEMEDGLLIKHPSKGYLTAYRGERGEACFARIANQDHTILGIVGRTFKVQIYDEDGMRYADLGGNDDR